MAALTVLDLWDNQLTSLLPELRNLTHLEHLNLHYNPLTLALPRALWEGGDAQEIFRFYRAIWEEGQALGEARLLFVGPLGAGKTSLAYRLVDGSYLENRPSTLTIETHSLPLGACTAQVWDFGGQDFMHATHPVFFSARCVYVLALNVRHTYEQSRVEYWLRTIHAYGGDSPVIAVGNHADAQGHLLDLPRNRLRREFPNIIVDPIHTSAKEERGLDDLRAALERAVDSLPHLHILAKNVLSLVHAVGRQAPPARKCSSRLAWTEAGD